MAQDDHAGRCLKCGTPWKKCWKKPGTCCDNCKHPVYD